MVFSQFKNEKKKQSSTNDSLERLVNGSGLRQSILLLEKCRVKLSLNIDKIQNNGTNSKLSRIKSSNRENDATISKLTNKILHMTQ